VHRRVLDLRRPTVLKRWPSLDVAVVLSGTIAGGALGIFDLSDSFCILVFIAISMSDTRSDPTRGKNNAILFGTADQV
jgi:hypothetical protein